MNGSSARDGYPTVASLLALSQRAKVVHEQVAMTMDRLAARGGPDADRRRELARRSRRFVELEDQHISRWRAFQAAHPRT